MKMRTVDHLEVSYPPFPKQEAQISSGLFPKLERHKVFVIIVTVLLAFGVRIYQIDAAGLSEDETNKVFALRAYKQGDFTANSEHPMLMKLLCFASTQMASAWNRAAGDPLQLRISEETALRLPNVIFGALTVIPLLLLTAALLGFQTGLITSLLWTFGSNAIWFNRVGKEDTLLLFFLLSGFYFYNRAKEYRATDLAGQEKLYALAGAAFAMMLASKYFPHYIALNGLFYTLIGYHHVNNRPLTKRMWTNYFGAMIFAFVICNPAIFAPQTWRYIWAFVNEDFLTHRGYLLMNELYGNTMTETPFGSPWYFYLLYLAVKLPLPIFLALAVGLVEIFRQRGDARVARGYLFLRMMLIFWIVPMSLIGSKFLRYSLSLMPLIYITAAVGILAMWRVLANLLKKLTVDAQFANRFAGVFVALLLVAAPTFITLKWASPHAGLYTNVIGGNRVGYFFPHDEFYDLGARESIKYIAENAPPNAIIASEIPGVVEYYLERYQRPDIRSKIMSQPDFNLQEGKLDYVLLQGGRIYFENRANFRFIESHFPLVQSSIYNGAAATQVYQTTLPQALSVEKK